MLEKRRPGCACGCARLGAQFTAAVSLDVDSLQFFARARSCLFRRGLPHACAIDFETPVSFDVDSRQLFACALSCLFWRGLPLILKQLFLLMWTPTPVSLGVDSHTLAGSILKHLSLSGWTPDSFSRVRFPASFGVDSLLNVLVT